ncbi:hypothetical protein [Kosakonia sp. WA-90]|uniref:rhamnosyltransferase WsaF family glycosyltransferase n=1 Tax=Kosakonia sp. WA-90 TaxID=3153576 RepID=UPI00325DD899
MINFIVKKLLSNRVVYRIAKNAYESNKASTCNPANYDIPEITPFNFVKSNVDARRINLFVPALSEKHVFGGIATALRFFEAIRHDFPLARIIVTDEVSVELKAGQFYSDWQLTDLSGADCAENCIVVAGNRSGASLNVAENDYFVSTAWWTAYNTFKALAWQSAMFGTQGRKSIYFIQDYEPGFYAWSSRFALADSTYAHAEQTIPVFNTALLKDFFINSGYVFNEHYFFEPRINPVLSAACEQAASVDKDRKILVYGRPGVERNLFNIVVLALRAWAQAYDKAEQWTIVSAGESHADIELGRGVKLESLGKLTLDQYIHQLSTSSVGLSLMLSPHPSYPPLEMASFGIRVVSNGYANKKLSARSKNIIEPANFTPESIAESLIKLCEEHENASTVIYEDNLFSKETEFSFAKNIVQNILGE